MTLIYFIIVLGVVVTIHEFGHFIFAKKSGIYVYEFSIGMGPKIFGWKRKNDETDYSIRLFPIGGYVQMAGESVDLDTDIPEEKRFQTKGWIPKALTVVAGVMFNFLLALVIFFTLALLIGAPSLTPKIGKIAEDYPISKTNLQVGDTIIGLDNKHISSQDQLLVELQIRMGKTITLSVKHENGQKENISITPVKKTIDGKKAYQYGFSLNDTRNHGFIAAIKYAFLKVGSLLHQMVLIIIYLFSGKLSLNSLSGPVGIFNLVGETAKTGIANLVFLIGYISVNVGFINLLPLPAFDGGRLLFLIIEKITGKPVPAKVENWIHTIGFVLLMILMVYITWNDIMRLI